MCETQNISRICPHNLQKIYLISPVVIQIASQAQQQPSSRKFVLSYHSIFREVYRGKVSFKMRIAKYSVANDYYITLLTFSAMDNNSLTFGSFGSLKPLKL